MERTTDISISAILEMVLFYTEPHQYKFKIEHEFEQYQRYTVNFTEHVYDSCGHDIRGLTDIVINTFSRYPENYFNIK